MRREFTNKILIGLFCLAWLFGCSYQVPKDPETLVWRLEAEPDTLNRLTSSDLYASVIQGFIFDSLIERDNQTLEFKPKMAERWTVSPDHQQFTFYLRDGIRWHDGQPVTVDDIVYSFERIIDSKVDDPHLKVYYRDIEKVEKLDARTVRFTYRRPYFMALEFCGGIPILPKHLYDNGAEFNTHPQSRAPIGMGPYRFVSWETGKAILLERNEEYWGKAIGRMPAIKRIRFDIVTENTVALQILKKGQLDLIDRLRPIQWVRQTGSEKFNREFKKYEFYTPQYSFIAWNMRKPVFADPRVRRALSMMVNREAMLQKLQFGLGTIVTGPFYFQAPENDPSVKAVPYDPDGARRFLQAAGWADHNRDGVLDKDGVPFRFEFLYPSGSQTSERLANILKEDLNKIGIQMEIRQIEWALFTKYLSDRNFDAVILAWAMGLEQDPYQLWHSSQSDKGSNLAGFQNAEADRIIEAARSEFDRKKRVVLYRQLHRIIDEVQPYTFLYNSPNLMALQRRFENVRIYPGGIDPLEWKVSQP